LPKNRISSSALWRGYVATFEIVDSILYVKDIEVQYSTKDSSGEYKYEWKSVLQEVFPDSSDRICSFYTGLLILPEGEMLNYVHMGYASLYEKYILMKIENGKFKKEKEFSAEEYYKFKRQQFEEYKKTDEYKKKLNEIKEQTEDLEWLEYFLFIYDVDYSNRFLLDEF